VRAAETYYAIGVLAAVTVDDGERHKGVAPGAIQMECDLVVMLAWLVEIDLFRGVDENGHLAVWDKELSLPEYKTYFSNRSQTGKFSRFCGNGLLKGKELLVLNPDIFPFFTLLPPSRWQKPLPYGRGSVARRHYRAGRACRKLPFPTITDKNAESIGQRAEDARKACK
jgi:hypothetical protein